MKMQSAWSMVAMGFGALVFACSSAPADPYPSSDAYCSARATEECAVAAGACAIPSASCKNARHELCMASAGTAIGQGRTYTSDKVQPCIDKLHSVYAKTPITPADLADAEDTCQRVFQGSAANGAPCSTDYQCSGTAICTKGACGNKVTKNPGDFCGNPGEVCGGDSYCSATVPAKCTPNESVGQSCTVDVPCSTTASPALRCLSGTCQAVLEAGGKCVSNADCDPKSVPYCDVDNGNICDDGIRFAVSNKGLCSHYGGTN